MGGLGFHEGEKFGVLAIEGVYSTIPEDAAVQLSDGTWGHTRLPVEIGSHWREWIGTLRLERLQNSKVILFRSEPSANPQILDGQHQQLGRHLSVIFRTLQLSGVLECDGARLLLGSFYDGDSQVRQMSEPELFSHTKGYTRTPLTPNRLEQATRFRQVFAGLESLRSSFEHVFRGFNVLMDGLKQTYAQERIHQFVRSLEALILPEPGQTRTQFVHRCQTFAKAGTATRTILEEAFDLRSDTEHLHPWDRSLQSYPANEREHVVLQRTRQLQGLACFAYSQILVNDSIREHFRNEAEQSNFWSQINDASRRAAWGPAIRPRERSLGPELRPVGKSDNVR
jgi:hypothetical protein